jgi:Flp pilus assembly pilin Flp
MSERKGKHRTLERGQSLVEYALILVLVATVVIIVLGLFGERIRDFYCQTVLSLAPDVDAPACNQMNVTCKLDDVNVNMVYMYADVVDNIGDNDVKTVDWYDNGKYVRTEYYVRYCLGSANGPCDPYTATSGSHKFSAVATDAEGHTGSCNKTVAIP